MLKSGEISPDKLNNMTSPQRLALFAKTFGETNAKRINVLLEKKMLLKNQQKGMITWAKEVMKGQPDITSRSIMDRINKLDKSMSDKELNTFLESLVEQAVGFNVDEKEFTKLTELGKDAGDKKEIALSKMEDGKWKSETDKEKYGIDFGASKVAFDNYLTELSETAKGGKIENIRKTFKEKGTVQGVLQSLETGVNLIAENSRAIVASLDNSFFGRQGLKALTRPATSKIWAKTFIKSFSDIGKTVKGGVEGGNEIMDGVKAEIYSRENYLNGNYQRGTKLDIGIREEEFPTSLPEKIPGLGRLFKASEVAYSAGAMRMRADIADTFYKMAENQGVNINNNEEVGAINDIVNIMTGRGSLGSLEQAGKELNKAFFSAKFMAAQVQSATRALAPKVAGGAKTSFARKQASKNLLSLVSSTAIIMAMMALLYPDRVEEDPRSTNFGKIKIGSEWIDITGGAGSYAVLASRILRQSYKNTYTGVVTKLNEGYGSQDGMDVFFNFIENKTSPMASVIKDIIKQRTFEGDKPTIFNEIKSLLTPIIVSTGKEAYEQKQQVSDMLLAVIADGMGFSVSDYVFETNWSQNTSNELTEFKEEVGEKEFKEANEEYNKQVSDMYIQLAGDEKYQEMNNDERKKDITKRKKKIKDNIIK